MENRNIIPFLLDCCQSNDFKLWNKRRKAFSDSHEDINLEGTSLEGLNLAKFNLACVNLKHANLRGCNLQEADLREANLQGANLQEANLQSVKFYNTNLRYANFTEANLAFSYYSEANAEEAIFTNANLMRAKIRSSNFQFSIFKEANLKDTYLLSNLENANFEGAILDGTIFGAQGYHGYTDEAYGLTSGQIACCAHINNIIARKKLLLSLQKSSPELMKWWDPMLYPDIDSPIFNSVYYYSRSPQSLRSIIKLLSSKNDKDAIGAIIVLAQKGQKVKKALPQIKKIVNKYKLNDSDNDVAKMVLYAVDKIKSCSCEK
ncbi:pentapeptide repeat-containing protein [Candidatus Uabimicrobium sp. HlEnr_7]|uniref:pentapeptide repeat-containing protein n=1 Tax=Candidatus Uabimicrobium helgolandensis TaxID=3095367 RepID=UPI003558FA40